ncbi:sigma 54-interacting transcriptional regulator, partial [Myxococcota bacterium]|nr:sigma 54-interacting transcriptional regulator [Myxococcota bacterium]
LGRFELADGGTLFLDEIGDLPMEIQVKILRILQEREFERVGGEETLTVNVRVISATHKDLETLVTEGTFRQDLYYRLNVFPIHIPPLRERRSDVKLLIDHFIERYSKITGKRITQVESSFFKRLDTYELPGNVRELENLVERAIILSSEGILKASDLEFFPSFAGETTPEPQIRFERGPTPGQSLNSHLQEEEKRQIIEAIESQSGNMAAAARMLGINRSTLYYRLRKYDLGHIIPSR